MTVVLHNTLAEATSIVFPGQTGVKANGNPAQPQFDGGGSLTSMVQPAAADNGSVTYTFTAGSPGTYLYESGTDVDKQSRWACTARWSCAPAGHPTQVNDRADSAFDPGQGVPVRALRGRPGRAPRRRARRSRSTGHVHGPATS